MAFFVFTQYSVNYFFLLLFGLGHSLSYLSIINQNKNPYKMKNAKMHYPDKIAELEDKLVESNMEVNALKRTIKKLTSKLMREEFLLKAMTERYKESKQVISELINILEQRDETT